MGEAVGFIQPIFWMLNFYLLKIKYKNEKKNTLLWTILCFSMFYWIYIFFVNSYSGENSNLWAILTSVIAFAVPGFVLVASYANSEIVILQKTFVRIVTILCASHLVQLILNLPCVFINFSNLGSRQYDYSVCLSGSISLGNRLTGIGGEPGIFAVEIIFALVLLSSSLFELRFRKSSALILLFGLISTYSSTGYVCLVLIIILYIFKKSRRFGFIGILVSLSLYFPFKSIVDTILKQKSIDAPFSVSDRGLDISPTEYVYNWSTYIFGNPDREYKITSINLLANSYYYGFLVIILYLFFVIQLYRRGPKNFDFQASLLVVSFTILFSQPPFLNTLWFILILLCASPNEKKLNSNKQLNSG
jgi:hypothetical protein